LKLGDDLETNGTDDIITFFAVMFGARFDFTAIVALRSIAAKWRMLHKSSLANSHLKLFATVRADWLSHAFFLSRPTGRRWLA